MDFPEIIALIRSRLDAIGPYPGNVDLDLDERLEAARTWRANIGQLAEDLRGQVNARITDKPAAGAAVLIAGIRCSSTSGIASALQGWCTKAERHVAERNAA